MKPAKNLNVIDPENEVPQEVLAKAIIQVAESAQKLLNGPLTRRAIYILIQDGIAGNVSLRDIESVLASAAMLKQRYVK